MLMGYGCLSERLRGLRKSRGELMITINIPIGLVAFVLGVVTGIVLMIFLAWLMTRQRMAKGSE